MISIRCYVPFGLNNKRSLGPKGKTPFDAANLGDMKEYLGIDFLREVWQARQPFGKTPSVPGAARIWILQSGLWRRQRFHICLPAHLINTAADMLSLTGRSVGILQIQTRSQSAAAWFGGEERLAYLKV